MTAEYKGFVVIYYRCCTIPVMAKFSCSLATGPSPTIADGGGGGGGGGTLVINRPNIVTCSAVAKFGLFLVYLVIKSSCGTR